MNIHHNMNIHHTPITMNPARIRRLAVFCFAFVLGIGSAFAARTWHVAGAGNDTHSGTTPETAFRSLQKAASLTAPGDTVLVGDGTYTDTAGANAVLMITKSGRPDAWITWQAAPGARPDVRPTGWGGLTITASYIVIDGIYVTGGNDSLSLEDALADSKKPRANPRFNSNGITIEGRKSAPDTKPHHITIRNCVVSKCPGGGINMLTGDYYIIEDNLVFGNAWYMRYAGSGISALESWAHDDKPGYHIIIQRNLVWDNKTLVPWERTGKLSDGNGIILDVTDGPESAGPTNPNGDATVNQKRNAASKPKPAVPGTAKPAAAPKTGRPEWKGRALIANNVSAYNGGSGIHTFRTRYVDIVNNTTYHNGAVVGYAELFANASKDIVILNNIIVPGTSNKVTMENRNVRVRWDYNLYPAAQEVMKGPNDIIADPRFVRVDADLRKADFSLQNDSRGLASGTKELAPKTDILGNSRPQDSAPSRGAYQVMATEALRPAK